MHMVWTERNASTPGNKDRSFTIRSATFGHQCRLNCRPGVHRWLGVEPEGCRSSKQRDFIWLTIIEDSEDDNDDEVVAAYFRSGRPSNMASS